MRFSNIVKAAATFVAISPAVDAAYLFTSQHDLVAVIGTKFTQQALQALWDAGVNNIPIDLAGAVNDDLHNKFGWGAFGLGIITSVKYTERALTSGAQGFFSISWTFPSGEDAIKGFTQIASYVTGEYKRDEANATDLLAAIDLTPVDFSSLPESLFPENVISNGEPSGISKRWNTVCYNPVGYSFTANVFNKVNPSSTDYLNQCESCQGGTRDGC